MRACTETSVDHFYFFQFIQADCGYRAGFEYRARFIIILSVLILLVLFYKGVSQNASVSAHEHPFLISNQTLQSLPDVQPRSKIKGWPKAQAKLAAEIQYSIQSGEVCFVELMRHEKQRLASRNLHASDIGNCAT